MSKFLEYSKNISWSYDDMPRFYPLFIIHNLPLKEGTKLIKQKPRKMHPSKALLFKKEV